MAVDAPVVTVALTTAVAPSPSRVEPLPVPGHGDAVVVVPSGEVARPVLVATHANEDRPEYACARWRVLVEDRAWVLCPSGTPAVTRTRYKEPRFTYRSDAAMASSIAASLDALRTRYGARVLREGMVYAGFSLGAVLGPTHLRTTHEHYVAAALVEGGTQWSHGTAVRFAAQGGMAVVFGCGQRDCAEAARTSAAVLREAGVASEVAYAPGAGHVFAGRVSTALGPLFARFVRPLWER